MTTDFEERRNKKRNDDILFYKEHQRFLIDSIGDLKIEEPFEIEILKPDCESNAFNFERGFFTTAYIKYKERLVAMIAPNLKSYGGTGFDESEKKYNLSIHGSFKELISTITFFIMEEGNGLSDKEIKILDKSYSYHKNLDSIQECIDYVKNIISRLHQDYSKFLDPSQAYKKYDPTAYIPCKDKFRQELVEGDYVDVQSDGPHLIYKKDDGQLYFKPYGKEDRVCDYASSDMVKCDEKGEWIVADGIL
jgi:hypothetical protein